MKPLAAVLLGLLVVLAGCSQLAGPVDEPATTAGPIEGTATPPNGSQSGAAAETRAPTTEAPTATRTATTTATATRTATVTRTPTVTATATPMPTVTRTVTSTTGPTTRLPSTTRTPSRPPTATAAGNGSGSRALALASVDAANETVLLRNAGQRRVNLDGYAVDFDDGQRYALPPYSLGAGANVTVHTGRGDDTRGDLYAGFLYPVINDGGDTVLVEAPNGRIVAAERVGGN